MGFYSRLVSNMLRGSWKLSQSVSQRVHTAVLRPSAQSRRLGILAPGDGPPSGSLGGFQDYRQILLPSDLRDLEVGEYPIGSVVHPHNRTRSMRAFLRWGHLRRHCAIIGPSGSGKTSNIIAPWIVAAIQSGASVVAIDVKGDLLSEIVAAKQRMGVTKPIDTFLWDIDDPLRSTGSWSPLQSVSSHGPSGAASAAQAILGEINAHDPQPFFAQRDHAWLRGLISLVVGVHGDSVHPAVLYRAVRDQEFLLSMIHAAPSLSFELSGIAFPNESDFLNATQGIANKISWFADPHLYDLLDPTLSGVRNVSRSLNFDILFRQPVLLVVGSRIAGGERSAMASSLLLNQLKLELMSRFARGNARPIFWFLDEASRYSDRVDLTQMLDLFRGVNAPVCLSVQDAQQLASDSSERSRMLGNCDTLVALKGVSQVTAQYFSERLGVLKSPMATVGVNAGQRHVSVAHVDTPILGQNEIMNPPIGEYGGVVQLRGVNVRPFLVSFG